MESSIEKGKWPSVVHTWEADNRKDTSEKAEQHLEQARANLKNPDS